MSDPRELWRHQIEMVNKALPLNNFGFLGEPGSGKTAACIHTLRHKFNEHKKILKTIVLCPPIVIENWKNEFLLNSKIPQEKITCLYGTGKQRLKLFKERSESGHIFITNYETLQMDVFEEMCKWGVEAVVVDECFHEDTLVLTRRGYLKIKNISVGEEVLNCTGWAKVRNVSKKEVCGHIELLFGGFKVVCSLEHPFFTNKGWVQAKNITPGEHKLVKSKTCMQILRGKFLCKEISSEETENLLRELWNELEGSGPRISKIYSGEKPNVQRKYTKKDVGISEENWTPTQNTWGEWKRSNSTGKISFGNFVKKRLKKMAMSLGCSKWKGESIDGFSTPLQARCSSSPVEDSYRARWADSLFSKITGRKENRETEFLGVDSIKIYKQRSPRGLSKGLFFDLEVEGHPSFTITGGVLVHNCHRVANYTSKRSKNVEKLVNGNMHYDKKKQVYSGPRPYVYILSGSPILNSPMDIFQQYKILDAGATFGANFIGFRARYFRDKNAGMPKHNYFPNWVPIAGALEEIGEKLNRNSMRVLKKDCMDLPPLIRKVIKVEMSGEQKKLYDSMVEDYVAYFTRDGKEEVTAAIMGMTKGIRLMQISSGYIKTVDGAEVDICEKYNPKQDALYSLLEDLTPNHKVIIWAVWIQNYEQIRRVLRDLKLDWLEINGLNGADKNRANAKEFEANSKIRVLIAHPESGGEGINLVSASYAITYSRTYSLRQDIQAEARNYRGGSEVHEKVTRIDLVSKDTIEEKILEMLANKQEVGDKVLRDITLQSYKREKS